MVDISQETIPTKRAIVFYDRSFIAQTNPALVTAINGN